MVRPRDMDTPSGRARQEEKYRRILDAALAVFAEKGFSEAKITEIAKQAGVADGTIYLYFKNKDDLLISLFEAKLEAINVGLRERLLGVEDPRDRLREVVQYHLELAADNPHLAAFITVELRRSAKFMKEHAKKQFSEYLEQLGQVVKQGKSVGVFRADVSSATVKHLLFGCLDQAVVNWVFKPNRRAQDLDDVGDKILSFVLHGLDATPRSRDI